MSQKAQIIERFTRRADAARKRRIELAQELQTCDTARAHGIARELSTLTEDELHLRISIRLFEEAGETQLDELVRWQRLVFNARFD